MTDEEDRLFLKTVLHLRYAGGSEILSRTIPISQAQSFVRRLLNNFIAYLRSTE
jgi:hypothetical protein